ncbi:unnamed protein product [Withania somnifera]
MHNQMTSFTTPNNNIPIHHHQTPHTFTTDHHINLNHNKYNKRDHNNNNNNNKNILLRLSGTGQCAPDCVLAPYFPHDRQRQFLNAHKLFGVSNITKIIRHLGQSLKDEAMRTIIFQSDLAFCREQAVLVVASEQQQIVTDHHASDQESFNDNCDGVVNQPDPLVNNNNASSYEQQPIDQNHPHDSYYNHPHYGQLDLTDINFPWSLHEREYTSTSAPNSLMKQLSVIDQCDNIKEPILERISGFGSFEQDQTFDQHSYSTREQTPIEGRG